MSEEKKKRSKKTIKIILIIAAAAALVLAAVYTLVIKPAQSEDKYIYKESKAVKGNLVKGIMESGTVTLTTSSVDYDLDIEETETEEESSSDDSDDDSTSTHYLEIENVSVTPGQRIAEGDELFSLSQNSIDAVRRNLEEDKADDEIALEEAQAELNVQVLAAKGTQNSSTTASSVASSLYSATVDELNADIESYTAEIQNLQAEVTQLVAERADEDLWTAKKEAQTALTTAKNVYDDTDVTNAAAYVANYEAYTKAKDTYDKAVDAIDTINDSIDDNNEKIMDDQELLTQAQAQLDHKTMEAKQSYQSSAAEGKAASDVYGYTVDSLQETVDEAQTTLDDASDSLSDFESFVGDDGIIRSDGAGLVTAVNYDAGDKLTDTGAMITYVKDGAYTVSIDVSEEDVSSIKIGDSVTIAFSAYPDETYNGTISEISTSSSDTHQTTVSYPVTVAIEGDTSKLYGGSSSGGGGFPGGGPGGMGGSNSNNKDKVTLSDSDIEDIEAFVPGITDGTLSFSTTSDVDGGELDDTTTFTIAGIESNYADMSNFTMAIGDFITDENNELKEKECVLGYDAAKTIFGSVYDAYDETVYIDSRSYTVSGVLSQMGTVASGISPDSAIFIPYNTGIKYLTGSSVSPTFTVIAENVDNVASIKTDIEEVLAESYPNATFSLTDAGSKMEAASKSNETLTMLLYAMAAIVFIVGGIGIMNVLFVSVKERTNEIGILKAIGCSRKDIMSEFLMEAMSISLVGAVIGVFAALAITPLLEQLGVRVSLSVGGAAFALLFGIFTGTVFGFYPAYKASRLIPVEALNAE